MRDTYDIDASSLTVWEHRAGGSSQIPRQSPTAVRPGAVGARYR